MRIHCFDHCSFAGVPPSGPRRTNCFPVATICFHWIVCSGCKTCLFHCSLDQKKSFSRSSPFESLIPEPFLWQLLKGHGSSLLAVKCANIRFSLSFIKTLCYHQLLCRNHLLLTHRTLSKDGLSTNSVE